MRDKLVISFFVFYFIGSAVTAQINTDTLHLKLPAAEKIFLDTNLLLITQEYNVDANKALIIQARLLPNPNFTIAHGLYSGTLKEFFPTGTNHEASASLSQLILLAGRRNKQIKLAQANEKLSEFQLYYRSII